MHIGRHIVQELALQFGEPAVERWTVPMEEGEFAELKGHVARGRAHDVTALIVRGEELVVIRKPHYPPGAYRAPSGGVHPEEAFLDGAVREAEEETGLVVEIEDYVLCIHVAFTCGGESVKWSTHVLRARPLSGELGPLDRAEVASARWMGWNELLNEVNPVLRDSGSAGLVYRARVHEKAHEILATRAKTRGK